MNRLTVKFVLRQKAPGMFCDGAGLYLQVINANNRSWIFRYKRFGKSREMGLGSVSTYTLDEARELARKAKQQIREGIDPLQARQARVAAEKLAANNHKTFRECVEGYYAAHAAKWSSQKWRDNFTAMFATYAFPVCGNVPVAAIDQALVMQCIGPIWHSKTPTASRLRGRIEEVLSWATVQGFRSGENPARWDGHIQHLLPSVTELATAGHHAALPFADTPAFMAALRAIAGIPARALELTVLCATRTTETIGARWAEFDLENKIWTIPADRMKAGAEHRIPLSARAIAILQGMPRLNDFVFPAGKGNGHLSAKGMVRLLQRMGYNGERATVHGFRSTFRTWSSELTQYPNEVLEMALAHTIKSKVEAAYRRGDLFIKRCNLMQDWADYCASTAAKVLTMPQRKSA